MKTFQFAERKIHAGAAAQWDALVKACDGGPATIIDLRTFTEVGDTAPPAAPEGWGYRRLPITGATVSEQDLDVFRREFFRKPQTVVVGPNAVRANLVMAASLARQEERALTDDERTIDEGKVEQGLLDWLTEYLHRHQHTDSSVKL